MRMAGEAIARQAGIENGDLAAGTAELQGGGEAGKAAADDDDVIHGDGLRVDGDGHGAFSSCFVLCSSLIRKRQCYRSGPKDQALPRGCTDRNSIALLSFLDFAPFHDLKI